MYCAPVIVEIYPREGTETTMRLMLPRSKPLKFIPVRGRKRISVEKIIKRYAVEIYPREGTETSCLAYSSMSSLVEIYPREGTETGCRSG